MFFSGADALGLLAGAELPGDQPGETHLPPAARPLDQVHLLLPLIPRLAALSHGIFSLVCGVAEPEPPGNRAFGQEPEPKQ